MLRGEVLVMRCLAEILRPVVKCFPFIFLLIVFFPITFTTNAQSVKLPAKEIELEELVTIIKKQAKVLFMYDTSLLRLAKPVNIGITHAPVSRVLEMFFKEQPLLNCEKVHRSYVIFMKEGVGSNAVVPVDQRNVTSPFFIKGRVIDEQANALEGVTVSVKGGTYSTSTNANGEFSMDNVNRNAVLVFTAVNIITYELKVNGQQQLLATLSRKIIDMEDVLVNTGYQDIRKNNVTGSFIKIDNELLNRRAGPSILQRITDITPGLLYNRSGKTNILDDITLRGVSTINSSKRPLLVVDNFIYEGDLAAIHVNDVESVTVLKDAAAASVWGVRSGNGVIVITMKKGKYKQPFRMSWRTEIVAGNKPDLFYIPSIPSREIIALERKRFADSSYNRYDDFPSHAAIPLVPEILLKMRRGEISPSEAEAQIRYLENHDIRNDINRYLLQTSLSMQHAFNLSGGGKKFKYFGSAGYLKGRPATVNVSDEQWTIRIANSWKPYKNLEIGAEFNGNRLTNHSNNSLEIPGDYLTSPYLPLANANGSPIAIPKDYRLRYLDSVRVRGMLDWSFLPLHEAGNGNRTTTKNNSRIAGFLNFHIINGLTASINYQWQKESGQLKDIKSTATYFTRNWLNRLVTTDADGNVIYPIPKGSIYNETTTEQASWNFRSQLSFDRKWRDHSLTTLAGFESREAKMQTIKLPQQYGLDEATGEFSPVLYGRWKDRITGAYIRLKESSSDTHRTTDRYGSYFANIIYSFKSRYNFSASSRIDKSNYFGRRSNEEIKPLWHIGFGWELSRESFFTPGRISYLRVRATYGYNGNTHSGISPSATGAYYPGVQPLFIPIAAIVTAPNARLRWERVRTTNLALDFVMLNNRLSGSMEWYKKAGLDLISSMPADPTTGFSQYIGNNARIDGKGVDVNLTSKNLVSDIQWQTTLLLSYNSEKVASYQVEPQQSASAYLQNPVIPGRPLDYISSLQWAGLDPQTGDARLIVNDSVVGSNNFLNASPKDVYYNGRATPSWFGALRNDLSWKNFAISINIVFKLGYVFRRSSFTGYLMHNTWQHTDYVNAWKKPGDEAYTDVPGFMDEYSDQRYEVYNSANILVERGDHIRLQDIRLSYELPSTILKKIRLTRVCFYTYCNNIGIIWRANKQKIDPDAVAFGTMPMPRTVAVGMNIVL